MSHEASPVGEGSVSLSQRRALLLATVVYEYIQSAEPVGSHTLAQKYRLGVSSATIRHEMAELEAAGYLIQPHTSSGRIPSDVGYRTYVDRLMEPVTLDVDEQRRIREELLSTSRELDDLVAAATRLLGRLTHSFAFTVAPAREAAIFRHVQLIWFSAQTGLAIVVTTLGVAAQHPFEVTSPLDADVLTQLSNRLNAAFSGQRLGAISTASVSSVVAACELGEPLRRELEVIICAALNAARDEERLVTSAGAQNLLDQPEFQDLRRLRTILELAEEQKALYELVTGVLSGDGEEPLVRIGQELGEGEMSLCSLIAVRYRTPDNAVGTLALLGPRRMPYPRLLALVAGTAASLTGRLAEQSGSESH